MKRGEVRWYKFDPPDKRRPAVILTRDSVLEYLGEITVAPVTSRIRDIPTQVVLSEQDGMPRECAVNCDHVQTVAKGKIGPTITMLPADRMEEVRQAIAFALDL
jgi:mRNA interferase MazF